MARPRTFEHTPGSRRERNGGGRGNAEEETAQKEARAGACFAGDRRSAQRGASKESREGAQGVPALAGAGAGERRRRLGGHLRSGRQEAAGFRRSGTARRESRAGSGEEDGGRSRRRRRVRLREDPRAGPGSHVEGPAHSRADQVSRQADRPGAHRGLPRRRNGDLLVVRAAPRGARTRGGKGRPRRRVRLQRGSPRRRGAAAPRRRRAYQGDPGVRQGAGDGSPLRRAPSGPRDRPETPRRQGRRASCIREGRGDRAARRSRPRGAAAPRQLVRPATRAVVGLATAGLACASAPSRPPPPPVRPQATGGDQPKLRGPVILGDEEPRLVLYEFQKLCGKNPTLLFALFETRLAYRLGDPCTVGEQAYRVVVLGKEDIAWVRERIDVNPLIGGTPAEVDYCPNCIGGHHYALVMKVGEHRFGSVKLHNPCSGNPSQADFPTANERYGAEAAEALVCSVDRLVDALPKKVPPPRRGPGPEGGTRPRD